MDLAQIATFWGVPTAITGLVVAFIKHMFNKQEEKREKAEAEKEEARKQEEHIKEQKALERERHREKLLLMLMQSTRAATVLSEATARAVQRIPDAKCNGDMTKALQLAAEVQGEQKDFLMELGIHSIYDN